MYCTLSNRMHRGIRKSMSTFDERHVNRRPMQSAIWAYNGEKFFVCIDPFAFGFLAVTNHVTLCVCIALSLEFDEENFWKIFRIYLLHSCWHFNAQISIQLFAFGFHVNTSSNIAQNECEWNAPEENDNKNNNNNNQTASDHFFECMWFHSSVCWLQRFDFSSRVFISWCLLLLCFRDHLFWCCLFHSDDIVHYTS